MSNTNYIGAEPDWSLIPDYMIGGLRRYIENGVVPGDFLTAVLTNDLRGACARADDTNRDCLFQYVQFLYSYAPAPCWGSPEKFSAWIKRSGLAGIRIASCGN
jgi:hypothetical protein